VAQIGRRDASKERFAPARSCGAARCPRRSGRAALVSTSPGRPARRQRRPRSESSDPAI